MNTVPAADPPPGARGAAPAAVVVATALACGIAAALLVPDASGAAGAGIVWASAAGVAAMGVLACITGVDAGRWTCLAGAALCAGLALGVADARVGLRAATDTSAPVQEGVVRLVGCIGSAPHETAAGADVLAQHTHGGASLVFELDVDAVETSDGHRLPVQASVFVRVQELGPLPPRGARVRVTGWYRPPGRAMNPGGRAPGGDGGVAVARLALIEALDSTAPTLPQRARLAADAALDGCFPAWAPETWRALVKAMTTGVRDPALAVPGAQFRMAGMSHVLAISGFNVAVLVGVGAALAAALGAGITLRAVAALVTSALFLLVTEPEVSVLRAGLGAGLAAVAGLRGGRARGLGALGAVGTATLVMDPSSLFNAGFQLSYGVVLGLLTLAGPPAERWQARAAILWAAVAPARLARSETALTVAQALVGACVSSVVAFTVSTPIALWHGGFVSTYAAPISVITMPAAALVTICGVAAIAVSSVCEAAAVIPGSVSCACAGFLAWTARTAADWPGTCWWIGRPAGWWLAAACVAVAVAWRWRRAAVRRGAWACVLVLATLAWWGAARPHGGGPAPGVLRVEALDVGNGSCILVRAGRSALLYDAGTSSDDSAGSRRIVPALAALGVRRLDALVISHAHMEHFSAVPEVVRAFDVQRILVAQPFAAEAARGGDGALRTLCDWLAAHGRTLEAHVAGDELRIGTIAVRVLAPLADLAPARRGDGSLVLHVRNLAATHERAAVLLTGGLEDAGCGALAGAAKLHPEDLPSAAVLELPHHGRWCESAVDLVRRCAPSAVLQSAGAQRVRRDRWRETLSGIARGVTAHDGALRAEIYPDGAVELLHWTGSAWALRQQDGAVETHDIANR